MADKHYAGDRAIVVHPGKIEDCPREACKRIVERARRSN